MDCVHLPRGSTPPPSDTGICNQKPQMSTTDNAMRSWEQFQGCSSPVLPRILPQTRKGSCPVEEQSFGMYNSHMHQIVSNYALTRKKSMMNKIEIFMFGFLELDKC